MNWRRHTTAARAVCALVRHDFELDDDRLFHAICSRCERVEALSGWHRADVEDLIERTGASNGTR